MKNSKFIIILLTINTFIFGLCEFVSTGITPQLAHSFNINVANAGLATTLYALSVMVLAPILISVSSKFNRKKILILVTLNCALTNFICAIAPNFSILLIGRILGGASHALFMTLGTLVATQISPKDKQSQAIAIMFSGLTIATIMGVPIGRIIATHFSWRYIFAFVSILSLVISGCFLKLPNNLDKGQKITFNSHLNLLKNKENVSSLLLTTFGYGASFVIYGMITPFIIKLVPLNSDIITLMLLIIGIFVALGNIIGGKISNKNTTKVLQKIFIFQVFAYLSFYLVNHNFIILIITLAFFGLMVFMNVSGLQFLNIQVSKIFNKNVVDISASYNVSAFNLGIATGSFIGGFAFDKFGYQYLPLFAAGMVMVAILITIINKKLDLN